MGGWAGSVAVEGLGFRVSAWLMRGRVLMINLRINLSGLPLFLYLSLSLYLSTSNLRRNRLSRSTSLPLYL